MPALSRRLAQTDSFRTLPDHLASGLDLIFVGINPGIHSVNQEHYFAKPTNRFWSALSQSVLSAKIRLALGRDVLGPTDDEKLLAFGIGFTDVVKRPSRRASDLRFLTGQKLRTRSASMVNRTRSGGVMNSAGRPSRCCCETPRASAQPFQT